MDPQQLQIVLGQLAHAFGMPPPPPLTPDQIASGSSLMSQLLATLGLAGNTGDPTDMADAQAGHAKRGEIGGRDALRLRKDVRQMLIHRRKALAVRRDQAAGEARRGDHGDLLAEYGAARLRDQWCGTS